MDPLDDVPQQAGAEPVDGIRSVEPRYGSVEWWVRETGDPDFRDASCSLGPDGSWCVVVPAMEFARGGIGREYGRRVTAAILAVDGVRTAEHEDREAWRVEGTPTGPALLEAVAVVIDEFALRLTTGSTSSSSIPSSGSPHDVAAVPPLKHDEELCLRVAHMLARRCGESVVLAVRPELTETEDEVIELVAYTQTMSIALEHTEIESFDQQTYLAGKATELVRPALDRVSPVVPNGWYLTLTVSLDGVEQVSKHQHAAVADEVAAWCQEQVVALAPEDLASRRGLQNLLAERAGDRNIPMALILFSAYDSAMKPGAIFHMLRVPPDDLSLEERRAVRLRRAVVRKLGKLNREPADLHVLVLENRDISLANEGLIVEALRSLEDVPWPEYVVLLDTFPDPPLYHIAYDHGVWTNWSTERSEDRRL